MDRLRFGTAGVPRSAKGRSSEVGITRIVQLGLDCMEMEFVHGVHMKEATASSLKPLAKKSDVVLTAHGPYYINLNAKEKDKRKASRERVLRTARIAKFAGAYSITFHAAFLLKMPPEKVQGTVKEQIGTIIETLEKEKNNIWVRPETTGKQAQWGTIDQILDLSQDLEQVMPCIDFAHLHAYENGGFNTYEEFTALFDKVEAALGKKALKDMHMHVSGIEYGPKGERRHLEFEDADFNHKDLVKALKDYDIKGCVICESPVLEDDALLLKREYESL